jgi:hypothetical protein
METETRRNEVVKRLLTTCPGEMIGVSLATTSHPLSFRPSSEQIPPWFALFETFTPSYKNYASLIDDIFVVEERDTCVVKRDVFVDPPRHAIDQPGTLRKMIVNHYRDVPLRACAILLTEAYRTI